MTNQVKQILAATVAVMAIGAAARGSVIATDNFEDAAVTSDLTSGAGTGAGWNGAWSQIQSTITLVSRSMTYDGGSVHVDGGNKALRISPSANDINAYLALSRPIASQTGTVYLSFLLQAPSHASDNFFQVGLQSDVSTPHVSAYIQKNSSAQQVFVAGANIWPNSINSVSSVVLDQTETYFVVLKASKSGNPASNYDQVSLYVNPTSDVELSQTPVAEVTGDSGISSLSNLMVRYARIQNPPNYYYMDNFTVGSDFASVVPTPEPGSALLLGLGGLMMLKRRRRVV